MFRFFRRLFRKRDPSVRECTAEERYEFILPIVKTICEHGRYEYNWTMVAKKRLAKISSGMELNMPLDEAIDLAIMLGD